MIVIAKAGFGLGGNLAVLADAVRLAEVLDCGLVADWFDCAYAVPGKNVAELLFSFPQRIAFPENLGALRVFPPQWQREVHRTRPRRTEVDGFKMSYATYSCVEEIGLERLIDEFDVAVIAGPTPRWRDGTHLRKIVPSPEIMRQVSELGVESSYVGVHFRHGNGERHVQPLDIRWYWKQCDDLLERQPSSKIFLATDCLAVLEAFRRRYGDDHVVSSSKKYRALGSGAMHIGREPSDRYISAVEATVDIWALARCGSIVGSARSYFTGAAVALASLPRRDVFVYRNPPKYFRHSPDLEEVEPGSDVGVVFEDASVPVDGLHVTKVDTAAAQAGGTRELYYYDHWLGEFGSLDDLSERFEEVSDRLRELRLY